MGSIAKTIGGLIGAHQAEKGAREARRDYESEMDRIIDDFMKGWEGDMPGGYPTYSDWMYGGERDINLGEVLTKAQRDELTRNYSDPEKQNELISEYLGYPVKLKEPYKWTDYEGWNVKVDVTPGAEEGGTLEEIQKKGGTPSVEAYYSPYIKSGYDAFDAITNAVVNGDFSGFYTSPGYEYRMSEAQKTIDRLAASGRIPTQAANKALTEQSQNIASNEYQNYLTNLNAVATMGYNALSDLESLQSYYLGNKASMESSKAANVAGMKTNEADIKAGEWNLGMNFLGNIVDPLEQFKSDVLPALGTAMGANSGEQASTSPTAKSNVSTPELTNTNYLQSEDYAFNNPANTEYSNYTLPSMQALYSQGAGGGASSFSYIF